MFYYTDQPHGLRHNPFNALVVPRPIGWISTISATGKINLAPYSFFNAVSYTPPQVMFSGTGPHAEGGFKDTLRNIQETGEFVVNLATWSLREAVNLSSAPAPRDVDEFGLTGLTAVPSRKVAPPRVGESPVNLECRLAKTVELPSAPNTVPNTVIFGEVLVVHIDDTIIHDGMLNYERMQPIGRLGGQSYCKVSEVFDMDRPNWPIGD